MQNLLDQIATWPFLNEPAYRWAIFFVGATAFIFVWNEVLGLMK